MNKVVLTGRLARDPDVRFTQSGMCVTSIVVAVNRMKQKDKDQEADFIPVVFWKNQAEVVGNNFSKGDRINLEGRIQVRTYDDKNGQKRWATEIIAHEFEFVETKKDRKPDKKPAATESNFDSYGKEVPYDEEIPF